MLVSDFHFLKSLFRMVQFIVVLDYDSNVIKAYNTAVKTRNGIIDL